MKTSSALFLLGLLLVSCAKEKKYKGQPKLGEFEMSLLSSDPNDPYVYVPSVENTPMNVTASRSYWLGEQKLVTFKFSENYLEVIEIPSDLKALGNDANFSPVFKLDITYKDYRCKKDEFGDCSNEEEEVNDASWDQKSKFKADFSKLTVLETNSLPEQLANLFNNCFTEKLSNVKSVKLDQESLNVTVERTLTAKIECADVESFDDLRNITFKLNYHYSFVKLSKLASKNYEPVVYPFTDQNSFGFFTTTTKKLTADNRVTQDSDLTYMNRWNPNRGEVVYYLNDAFYEEGKGQILKQTYDSIATINKSFEKAGVDLRVKLEDGRGKSISDLRNNFIVLVDDPQASGVIGYGPTVANPRTGEILKGQVVMYYGTIKKFISETYDQVLEEEKEKIEKSKTAAAEIESIIAPGGILNLEMDQSLKNSQEGKKAFHTALLESVKSAPKDYVSTSRRSNFSNIQLTNKLTAQNIKSEIFSHTRMHKEHSIEDKVEEMSRNNVYHESMMNWHAALESAMADGVIKVGKSKPWNSLKDSEKETLIEQLMPYVWSPTLVHEFGHNLGLRHNFNGSEDKDNYYTQEERNALDIKRDVTYSSVMDYSYSSLNQLSIMGKYDIAALKFGYKRQFDLADGSVVSFPVVVKVKDENDKEVDKTLTSLEELKAFKHANFENIKSFEFCTDEHVAVNAKCKRFDEGSNLKEIAQHHIRAYKKNYAKRNKRNNRLNYSSVDDADYYSSVEYTFHNLRLFFETFDRIKGMYSDLTPQYWGDVEMTDADWEKIPAANRKNMKETIKFLKDLKAATKIAANFFVEVLKTPSVHCAVAAKGKPEVVLGLIPLSNFSDEALDCFDKSVQLKEEYMVIGQAGKHFNHVRGADLRGDLKADPTQLDVRGIWVDKVLAMKYLTVRELGISTFDDYRNNFLDHPEFQEPIMDTLLSYLNDKFEFQAEELKLEVASGKALPLKEPFIFELEKTHQINKSFSRRLNRVLGISKVSTDIRELLVPLAKNAWWTSDKKANTRGLYYMFDATRYEPSLPQIVFNAETTFKDEAGRSSIRYLATDSNLFATSLINIRNTRDKLATYPAEKVLEVAKARHSNTIPETIPAELKELYTLDLNLMIAFIKDEIPKDEYFLKTLDFLSRK